jgi:ribosomal protein L11 methyltransferase
MKDLKRTKMKGFFEEMCIKPRWIRVEISCNPECAEDLSAELAQAFAVSVEITGLGVCLYLDEERFVADGQQRLERVLDDFSEAWRVDGLLTYASSPFAEDDWLEKWKVNFKPLRVGKHWIIAPTWDEVNSGPRDRMIRIDPGRAFGTGHHESTRLCLEWLEAWSETQRNISLKSLLDLGTGSGILAIAGALLGFRRIVAVDNDQEAIEVARENIELNGVADKMQLQTGTVDDLEDRFEVILANIQALPLMNMAGRLVARLEDSATLVLSGVLLDQREQVQGAYETEGLKLCGLKTAGEWCLLELVRGRE